MSFPRLTIPGPRENAPPPLSGMGSLALSRQHHGLIVGSQVSRVQLLQARTTNQRRAKATPFSFAPNNCQRGATKKNNPSAQPISAPNFEAPQAGAGAISPARPVPGDLRHSAGVYGAQQLAPGGRWNNPPRRGARCGLRGEKDPHGEPKEKNTFRVPRGEPLVTAC